MKNLGMLREDVFWQGLPTADNPDSCYATGSASANTKGAWIETIASMPFDGYFAWDFQQFSANDRYFIDIGIGAAGSEVVLIENLHITVGWNDARCWNFDPLVFPFYLPAGTRIAMRCQSNSGGSDQVYPQPLLLRPGGFSPSYQFGKAVTLGANTANTYGLLVQANATKDNWGAWAEVSSSVPEDARALMFSINLKDSPAVSGSYRNLEVGLGGAGSEVAIITPWHFYHGLYVGTKNFLSPIIHVSIPAGQRLAVRQRSAATPTGSSEDIRMIFYLFV